MAQLTQIRQKFRSIVTTKKITHAVRLVSMSLYSKLEKQKNNLQNYTKSIFQLFNYAKTHNPEWKNKILMPGNILDSKPLFIIISTTKGLCGSLNSNLLKYIQKTLILENHQKWRRGDDSVPMTDPKELSESLDVTLELLRRVSNIPKDDKILDKHESLETVSGDKFSKEHRAGFWRGSRWMRTFITKTNSDISPKEIEF